LIYNSKKITHFGKTFDSKKEGERYLELRSMEKRGDITKLETQPVYKLSCGDIPIKRLGGKGRQRQYTADFTYLDKTGKRRVEDVKPRKKAKKNTNQRDKPLIDAASSLRMATCEACHGFLIDIIY
tara:strand:- start:233 stop:610 length:378 start_codon:yes stop_codon:yes gene_type:complete